MEGKIELLAPGGDVDSIKAAIAAGADAVYCGLNRYNARNRAENITIDDLNGILRLAHSNDCIVFITLNILILESEIPDIIRILNKLINTSIDGVIIQDLGLFYLISRYFGSLKIHASTQLTTHNEGQIKFLHEIGAGRVNLSRELNIHEIDSLTKTAHAQQVLSEVFVHGSYCLSFSGLCYMSSFRDGNSANRGRCSQPCRDQYSQTSQGVDFPLNLKDNSAFTDLRALYEAGVDSIKIEGRIKKFPYVYKVVKAFRKQLQNLYSNKVLSADFSSLYSVFNRDFSNSFLKGVLSKEIFIDYPRDNSANNLDLYNSGLSLEEKEAALDVFYEEKVRSNLEIKHIIDQLSVSKAPLSLNFSGKAGEPMRVSIKTHDTSFTVISAMNLVNKGSQSLDSEMILKRFKAINDTEYTIEDLDLHDLEPELFIPFKELTSLKNQVLFILNNAKETLPERIIPEIRASKSVTVSPSISVLISSEKDVNLCAESSADIYFQLANALSKHYSSTVHLFRKHSNLTPWFPSVLIGEDYDAAKDLLRELQPQTIVTNNSGIAYEASKMGISWIAGPYMNIVNSYSLLCLKENYNCSGSFISNELNKQQIRSIKKPDDFSLYYSIYHPIVLMTSRLCLFQQVNGCEKDLMDEDCLGSCTKSATITNLKQESFILNKERGAYNFIYAATNFLNMDIVTDLPGLFSAYFIDLRDIKTETKTALDKLKIIHLFEEYARGKSESKDVLQQVINPTNMKQYVNGL